MTKGCHYSKSEKCSTSTKCWIPPFNIPRIEIPIPPPPFIPGTAVFSDPGETVFNVPDGATFIEYFIIGGGGGGAGNGSTGQASLGGGGGGGRGLYYFGTFPLDMGNIINIVVGSGGAGGLDDGNSGGTSSIFYGINNINAIGGNPGLKGGPFVDNVILSSTGGNGGDYSGGGGGGGIRVTFAPNKPGGIGGDPGQGTMGQNGGSTFIIPNGPAVGGTGGDGGNGVFFLPSFDPIFSGLPGLGGTGSFGSGNRGGGGGGAGGVGTNNILIQAQNGLSISGNGKGGFGYGSGGGGSDGRQIDEIASGGAGFSGLVVIKYF